MLPIKYAHHMMLRLAFIYSFGIAMQETFLHQLHTACAVLRMNLAAVSSYVLKTCVATTLCLPVSSIHVCVCVCVCVCYLAHALWLMNASSNAIILFMTS